jgi:PRC-barrel domain
MTHRLIVGRMAAVAVAVGLLFAKPVSVLADDPPAVSSSEWSGLHGIFGEHVRDLNGDDAGRLWDILIDDAGKPRAAVIDYGGMLGVGKRKVAVSWDALQFVPSDKDTPIHLALTKQQLGVLPEFKYDSASAVVGNGQ